MNSTSDIKGLPTTEEQPLIYIPRFKQPISGLLAFGLALVISILSWWIFFHPAIAPAASPASLAALIGGFGLIGLIWAIWFENWPYKKYKNPIIHGLVGTAINLLIAIIFTFVLLPIFIMVYDAIFNVASDEIAAFIGAAIFGALSASCFSFSLLWTAGTMYWPFFNQPQPQRGLKTWIVGTLVMIITWAFFFLPSGNPSATTTSEAITFMYGAALAWTQWTIFFSLLTMLALEYWPWTKFSTRQPKMGMIAFVGCSLLGLLLAVTFPLIVAGIVDPMFQAMGFRPPADQLARLTSWGVMNITFADWLIVGVVLVTLYFDNWPKSHPQKQNFLYRVIIVIVIGLVGFFLYYFLAPPLLGENANPFEAIPTNFLIWLLWIAILHAHVWKKWPIHAPFKI